VGALHSSKQSRIEPRSKYRRDAAKGEVFAYTDSDCMVDPDWLYYLIGTLVSSDYSGVGGPNVTPPAKNWIQACVAAAPGGPSHVLLTDVVAEHIPGCNMAFYRWAFESVGGFDTEYRKAGDDVDFCWRIQAGWLGHCFQSDRDRVALSAFYASGLFQAAGRLRRSRIAAAFQTFDLFRTKQAPQNGAGRYTERRGSAGSLTGQ